MKELINRLYSIGAIKFGTFTLKRDFISPFYIHLSLAISHPQVAKKMTDLLWKKVGAFPHDLLCGIPSIGSCMATYIAWSHDQPLVLRHHQEKGIPKILGHYKTGQTCLLIGGLSLSGSSCLDLIDDLETGGLVVKDILLLFDLQLGAKQKIKQRGYTPHFLISFSEVTQILHEEGKIGGDTLKLVTDFLEEEEKGKKS